MKKAKYRIKTEEIIQFYDLQYVFRVQLLRNSEKMPTMI